MKLSKFTYMSLRITALLLCAGFLLQVFNKSVTVSGFMLERDYISSKLCVNKSKPQMHCHGKCYLMKELKKVMKGKKATQQN